jgi:hypothetical protein
MKSHLQLSVQNAAWTLVSLVWAALVMVALLLVAIMFLAWLVLAGLVLVAVLVLVLVFIKAMSARRGASPEAPLAKGATGVLFRRLLVDLHRFNPTFNQGKGIK